jgi:diguanylate cyclase (GGDEF)-like protein
MESSESQRSTLMVDPMQEIKNKLIDRLWVGSFIIAIIGAPISALRSLSTGWLDLYSLHIILAIFVGLIFICRKRISFTLKSHILVFIFYAVGVLGIFSLGLLGAGVWWLIVSGLLVSTLYSTKYGILSVLSSAIIIAIAGYCFSNGLLTLPVDAGLYVKSYSSWVTLIIATTIMPFYVFQSISSFQYATANLLKEVDSQRILIEKMATHDQLTGLYMLTPAQKRLEKAMIDAQQSNSKLAFLFFDIDGFKVVNDKFGHDAGDYILTSIAKRIILHICENDTAARIGGDEIIVILSNVKDKESISDTTQKIIDDLAKPYYYHNQKINITASVGISLFPDDATNAKLLKQKADVAMYTVKKSGKNGIAFVT